MYLLCFLGEFDEGGKNINVKDRNKQGHGACENMQNVYMKVILDRMKKSCLCCPNEKKGTRFCNKHVISTVMLKSTRFIFTEEEESKNKNFRLCHHLCCSSKFSFARKWWRHWSVLWRRRLHIGCRSRWFYSEQRN